jgi:hypothetical protein
MKNKNILIGIGIMAIGTYLIKKDSSGKSVYSKLIGGKTKVCKKWADIQCISSPCPAECLEY